MPRPRKHPPAVTAPTTPQRVPRYLSTGPAEPYAEFAPDGTWTGTDGCNGLGGVWRLAAGGLSLATTGPMTAMGCEGMQPVETWIAQATRAGLPDNCAATQPGAERCLTLFDAGGTEIARLFQFTAA